jgi:hypothetical protein
MPGLRQMASFLWAERSLLADPERIRLELSARLNRPLLLKRFIRGRGWGLKYLMAPGNRNQPAILVKIASRILERRIQRSQGGNYLPPFERYSQETEVIQALAREGLGPHLIDSGSAWFARDFMEGRCLNDLPPDELAAVLPRVLAAVDRAVDAGIFHTDMNSNNVIIGPDCMQVGFIDSEWPKAGPLAGLDSPAVRRYCHRRLLFTLGRDYRAARETGFRERLTGLAEAHYGATDGPLSREETSLLLSGRGFSAGSVE